jgi:alkanesulfonate monooxygenase SsuD/methylene tetrahydromethanopterin reductase-like flavin-dependent oxidoreductase (luciferase family)
MATTVDEVSHGRVILGIGAGWNEPEYQAFGLPFDHRVGRFEEALQILKPLLHEGHVDFAGQYYQARNCDIVPRGPRSEGPPLMVGCERGSPRMLKLTAQYADLWNTGYMGKPETMVEPLTKIGEACRAVGRDPATMGITALIGLWFPNLQVNKPSFFEDPLIGTVEEITAAMRGYAELGVQHIMFQCEPYSMEARRLLTEALQLYRGIGQQ